MLVERTTIMVESEPVSGLNLRQVRVPSHHCLTIIMFKLGVIHACKVCSFPFKYSGTTYHSCTNVSSSKGPWCATDVSTTGEYWSEHYTFCPPGFVNNTVSCPYFSDHHSLDDIASSRSMIHLYL